MLSERTRAWSLLWQLFERERPYLKNIATELGLSPVQLRLVGTLSAQGARMGELAETLSCDTSNVTGLVDRLDRQGLLRRESDPADRRAKRILLTDRGREVQRAIAQSLQTPPPSLKKLTDTEVRTLCEILERALDLEHSDSA